MYIFVITFFPGNGSYYYVVYTYDGNSKKIFPGIVVEKVKVQTADLKMINVTFCRGGSMFYNDDKLCVY